jgi:hypothetical protein
VQVKFGNVFEGERRTQPLFIVNNSPATLKFSIDVISAASVVSRSSQSEEATTDDADSNPNAGFVAAARARVAAQSTALSDPFDVLPRSGELPPFQKAAMHVEYFPRTAPVATGFTSTQDTSPRTHRFVAVLDFGISGKQPQLLPLSGTALAQAVAVTPATLMFGDVPCNGHRHLNCEIRNVSLDQLVRFRTRPTLPHYFVDPNEGLIAPGAMAFLAVMYRPKAMGFTAGHLVLEILTDSGALIGEQRLDVSGSSNTLVSHEQRPHGPSTLQEDFVWDKRYATEAEVARGVCGQAPKFHRPKVPVHSLPMPFSPECTADFTSNTIALFFLKCTTPLLHHLISPPPLCIGDM